MKAFPKALTNCDDHEMRTPTPAKWIAMRFSAAYLGILMMMLSGKILGQESPERFWLSGRYDGNRVVVYFDTVQFGGTMASRARKIAPPVADLLFDPVELPASYIAGFQQKPSAEHFATGERYDLVLGNGTIATIKLTTLVGCETDEEVGSDSFVGALATVEQPNSLLFTQGYYAVRRHRGPQSDNSKERPKTTAGPRKYASLIDSPTRFDIETQMVRLLDQRMKIEATDAERLASDIVPALKVQSFHIADGSLRYYVRANWKSGRERGRQYPYSLAAWMDPLPTLHILTVERRTTGYGDLGLPDLLNVVDLGGGRTGIIVEIQSDASRALNLLEYHDGTIIKSMRVLQSIGVGE